MLKTLAAAAVVAIAFASPAMAQSVAGTYAYNGTDTDGSKYDGPGALVVKQAASGAYDVVWDGGSYLGVGQVTGNVFAVAAVADGKNSIMLFDINPDGSLSGKWWRRADKGKGGTEVWTKK